MKFILFTCMVVAMACVQKTHKKTVVYQLLTPNNTGIEKVSIKGSDQPLSWQQDTVLNTVVKDSLYTITITTETGYKFTEVKFLVNDVLELEGKDNRRVVFAAGDTTFYKATFNE
ncbi:MAG: hypothetical protein ACK4HE_02060 [Chitinophagaceae bacterium]